MLRSTTQIRRARIALALVGLVALGAAVWGLRSLPSGTWGRWVESLSPATLVIALTVLPVFGFPISLLHIATGARFGLALGTVAVAGSTLIHLLAAFSVARWLKDPLCRLLAVFGWTMPTLERDSSWAFSFWVALLPGVSYALKNVVAPLAGISLRVFLATALPTHLATALVGLGIGRTTVHFSWTVLGVVLGYAVVLAVLTRTLARRFRARASDRREAATLTFTPGPGRTPPEDDQMSPG